ncbi:uncharacterized protein ARMOST_13675 [Armillaria ostoyae]|uniref:Uncharacterized protein n=1 Tax=Armillaria ostoyae TaxID=47428 RepID=A0A284RNJ8_ARMOS|nr:uncharacterized protein ARMOST_13675 [Armillaria ostoyae]
MNTRKLWAAQLRAGSFIHWFVSSLKTHTQELSDYIAFMEGVLNKQYSVRSYLQKQKLGYVPRFAPMFRSGSSA